MTMATTQQDVIKPQQERSQSTHDKIVDAGRDLIRAGQFDQAGFRQIVETAGVSVGAFYGRFRNKEALFQFVLDQFFAETLVWADATTHEIEAKTTTLDGALTGAVRTMIDLFARDLGLMRAIYLRTRLQDNPDLLKKVSTFDGACFVHIDRMILTYASEITHADPREALHFGMRVLGAYLRDTLFFQNCPERKVSLGRNSKIEREATDLLKRYLVGSP
jgi:AcrR family transcriptional regulator